MLFHLPCKYSLYEIINRKCFDMLPYLYSPDHILCLHNMFRQFFNFIGNHLTNLLGLYEDLNHYLPFGGAKC